MRTLKLVLTLVLFNGCASVPDHHLPTWLEPTVPEPDDEDEALLELVASHQRVGIELVTVTSERAEHEELKLLATAMWTTQAEDYAKVQTLQVTWFGNDAGTSGDEAAPAEVVLDTAVPLDKALLDALIAHHQASLELATLAADTAKHFELRLLARTVLRRQQLELKRLEEWRGQWFPELLARP